MIETSPTRRVAYSLLGLAAGDAFLFLYMLISAGHARSALLAQHIGDPASQITQALLMSAVYVFFSLVGWMLVGAPTALFVEARAIAQLHWVAVLAAGVALGPVALYLMLVLLSRGAILGASVAGYRGMGPLFAFSAADSTVAFVVYYLLLRRWLANGAAARR